MRITELSSPRALRIMLPNGARDSDIVEAAGALLAEALKKSITPLVMEFDYGEEMEIILWGEE